MTKHARFLHIERAPAGEASMDDAPESQSADRARFAAVIAEAPLTAAPQPIELADRPAGDGEPPDWLEHTAQMLDAPADDGADGDMALALAQPEGQPFVRCARCGADSTIHATACQHCAARLDTPEQRAFNERIWEAQRRRSEAERAALEQMAEARFESAKSTIRPLPGPGMKPPPELLEAPNGDRPMIVGALMALQQPRWRWAAGAAAVGLPLFLVTLGGPIVGKLGWLLLLALVLSLLPRSFLERLFDRWLEARRRR